MKTIIVSTAVFAAIWGKRQDGEETEDTILGRLLGLENVDVEKVPTVGGGVHIDEFNVDFAEGAEIFRNYKGTEYRARATSGRWLLLNDGKTYPSLHKLSWAVVAGRENSWTNWRVKQADGKEILIDALRAKDKVRYRII